MNADTVAKFEMWLAFLNTVRTERFNDIMGLKARVPAIAAA
jgi:hypothetical protein